jgi:hypothetical protein
MSDVLITGVGHIGDKTASGGEVLAESTVFRVGISFVGRAHYLA